MKQMAKQKPQVLSSKKRVQISQTDIPSYSLSKALRVAVAIHENYGKDPAKPLWVAQAMNVAPASSNFKMITGASIGYGLTEGGYNAAAISITSLGRKIVAPSVEGEDAAAKREAVLRPRIVADFLRKYDGSPLPPEAIAMNVLDEMGVPRDRAKSVYELILENANEVGFLKTIKEKRYVDLHGTKSPAAAAVTEGTSIENEAVEVEKTGIVDAQDEAPSPSRATNSRVFITHGKNQTFIEPIKKLLSFGGFEAVVAAEKQTIAQPVPDKVMETMRLCGSSIIHIDAERKLMDTEAQEHAILNPNVLIEIGAAMALYGKRFILLVRDGVQLPSNLQGLYEVRYQGDQLDSDVTIKLLEAINDMKSRSLPIE